LIHIYDLELIFQLTMGSLDYWIRIL